MPAARAASSRLIPSEALASANRRLLTRPSRSRRASARSSAGVRPVAIGTATMASAPGLLSLPSQLAGRRRRSRLSVAGMRHRGNRAGRGTLALALLLAAGASPAWAATTERVSVGPGGVEANGDSYNAVISVDARYVAFLSDAANLVPGVANGKFQLYLHDRQTNTNELISVGLGGKGGNADSFANLSLSADDRYVVFQSEASDLVTGDTNGVTDTFVRDRVAHTTFRADLTSAGAEADQGSLESAISANGRYVVFSSTSTNLVSGDTPDSQDVFVRDLQAGTTERVSIDHAGQPSAQGGNGATISANGRYVAFIVMDPKEIKHGILDTARIWLRDRQNGTTRKISFTADCHKGNSGSFDPWVTGDGRYISFFSTASNLVPGDTNGAEDVFVRDVRARTI